MKTIKLIISAGFLGVFCVGVAYAEYRILLGLGLAFTFLATISVLVVLLRALLNAPEGYEHECGFGITAPRRRITPVPRLRLRPGAAAHIAT